MIWSIKIRRLSSGYVFVVVQSLRCGIIVKFEFWHWLIFFFNYICHALWSLDFKQTHTHTQNLFFILFGCVNYYCPWISGHLKILHYFKYLSFLFLFFFLLFFFVEILLLLILFYFKNYSLYYIIFFCWWYIFLRLILLARRKIISFINRHVFIFLFRKCCWVAVCVCMERIKKSIKCKT